MSSNVSVLLSDPAFRNKHLVRLCRLFFPKRTTAEKSGNILPCLPLFGVALGLMVFGVTRPKSSGFPRFDNHIRLSAAATPPPKCKASSRHPAELAKRQQVPGRMPSFLAPFFGNIFQEPKEKEKEPATKGGHAMG